MRRRAGVCLWMAALALAPVPAAFGDQASKLHKEGRKAERAGEMARAYLLYSQAAALAPKKNTYWLRSQAVRTRAALQPKVSPPVSASDPVDDFPDEPDTAEPVTNKELREARKPLPPTELQALPGRKDFNLKAAPKLVFEQVGGAFGLDVVFDGDYPEGGSPLVFRIDQADYREAL